MNDHRRPVKRSLTLRRHRTSVSLEDIFWDRFRTIADQDGKTINGLAAEIDEGRGDISLASALRVFVLERALADHGPLNDQTRDQSLE
ncbi:ribbon-helix-helix domain-containing protein [Yoonia sp.]|uniref:ribbon-helix-helix domain-containing protein n=1 Tax=Yoonia sp. TaxID=2212373 RepID=UPI001A00C743|nr:ribbon-helix-helix domain-containing protein [Yoonia sp.]MBE0413927.1 ribbon-helix-helix domain-containing protein [Yoonia sp.]